MKNRRMLLPALLAVFPAIRLLGASGLPELLDGVLAPLFRFLGVPEETIARCNVVSEEVACAMAKSAREQLDVDIAVSATGLAGPDGGTPERPVGTVFLGIATRERVYAVPLHLSGNRARIRTLTVKHALHAVTREIKGEMEG